MKNVFRGVIFVALLGLGAQPVTAAPKRDIHVLCPTFGNLAEKIMEARQSGVSMSKLMATTDNVDEDGELMASIVRTLIQAAYEEPRYSTEEFIARSVEDFRTKVEVECYK